MVAAGLLGALSLAFMQLMKNINQAKITLESHSDEIELRSSIRMILDRKKHCRISLAGPGPEGSPSAPVVFRRTSVDEPKKPSEGIPIAFYLSNSDGDGRTLKKFNGRDNDPSPGGGDKSKIGKITLKTIKLYMNAHPGHNYPTGLHNDIGLIRVVAEKKISGTQRREMTMDFDVDVEMSTNSSHQTTILACQRTVRGLREMIIDELNKDPEEFVSPGAVICSSDGGWTSATSGKMRSQFIVNGVKGNRLPCKAPRDGYYRGVDHYRGYEAYSQRVLARKGDTISIVGTSREYENTYCDLHIYRNGIEKVSKWGTDECGITTEDQKGFHSVSIIYSYDQ